MIVYFVSENLCFTAHVHFYKTVTCMICVLYISAKSSVAHASAPTLGPIYTSKLCALITIRNPSDNANYVDCKNVYFHLLLVFKFVLKFVPWVGGHGDSQSTGYIHIGYESLFPIGCIRVYLYISINAIFIF